MYKTGICSIESFKSVRLMIYTKFLESSFYVTSFVLLLSFACSANYNNSSELLAKYGFLSNAKNAKRFAKECKVFTLSLCPLRYCSISLFN